MTISAEMFEDIMVANKLDAVEQIARYLARRDDLDPDGLASMKRPDQERQPPMRKAWMWYIDEAAQIIQDVRDE